MTKIKKRQGAGSPDKSGLVRLYILLRKLANVSLTERGAGSREEGVGSREQGRGQRVR